MNLEPKSIISIPSDVHIGDIAWQYINVIIFFVVALHGVMDSYVTL